MDPKSRGTPVKPDREKDRFCRFMNEQGVEAVQTMVVLGSGLSDAAGFGTWDKRFSYHELPGLRPPGVRGHHGALLYGQPSGRKVFLFQGRSHLYEGLSFDHVTRHIAFSSAMGATEVIITNAAGGLNNTFSPGDFVLVRSHIDLMFRRFGTGDAVCAGNSSRRLEATVKDAARSLGIAVREGVYGASLGPSYETASEVRALKRIGADCVGMSSLPEVMASKLLGMDAAVISVITNVLRPGGQGPTHSEVVEAGQEASRKLSKLLGKVIEMLSAQTGG